MRNKMEIGQRYRQNSTGSEVLCVGHDQGDCVVRYFNRYSEHTYVLRAGGVGRGKTEWTKIPLVHVETRKVIFKNNLVLNHQQDHLSDCNVAYTFQEGKLVGVELINN